MMVDPMLRFIENKKAIMSLTLSQIGLIIATGIILVAVFSICFFNDWQKKAEIKNITYNLSTKIEGMDTRFFENKTTYYLPDKNFGYNLSISTDYIITKTNGIWYNKIIYPKFLIRKILPRQNNTDWITGKEFHSFLNDTWACFGNKTNPIMKKDVANVKKYIENLYNSANKSFALNPFYINNKKAIFIEKIFVYYDLDGNNIFNKDFDEKNSLLIIYQ